MLNCHALALLSLFEYDNSIGYTLASADEVRVKQVARQLVSYKPDRISEYADFNLRFGGSSALDGSHGIMIGLTEYWLGDDEGNDGLDSEVLIARDTPLAERFAEELQETLGEEFEVEPYCGDW